MNQYKHVTLAIASLLLLGMAASPMLAADKKSTAEVAAPTTESGATEASTGKLGAPQPPSATQQNLAKQFADAINSKDASKLQALIAPKSLACFDQARQLYLNIWIQRQFRTPIDKDYQVTVAALTSTTVERSRAVTFPLPPTHILIISRKVGGKERKSHRMIAEQDGKWMLVLGCPTKETLEKFTKSEQIKAKANERADKVMSQVKEPLTKEVRALLAKGDRIGATRLCVATLHTDPLAARVVVDRIGAPDVPAASH